MSNTEIKKRTDAAYKLLLEENTTKAKFEQIRALLSGINPRLDKALGAVSESLSKYEKISNKDAILLTTESLPESTEKQKKKKKTLILLINNWRALKSEVEHVQSELQQPEDKDNHLKDNIEGVGRLIYKAKGPFGIITLIAVASAGALLVFSSRNTANSTTHESILSNSELKGIIVNGNKIPLSELRVGLGSECDQLEHYHAKNDIAVKSLEGNMLPDPGNCGYGKVSEVEIVDIK